MSQMSDLCYLRKPRICWRDHNVGVTMLEMSVASNYLDNQNFLFFEIFEILSNRLHSKEYKLFRNYLSLLHNHKRISKNK